MAKTASAKKSGGKAPSKSEVLNAISQETGLARKDVSAVLEALTAEIGKHVGKKGPGVFQIPGLIKIVRQNVPAKPARKNAPDPFNPGQFRDYPAKPASVKVKVRALKNLKGMV
jgi:Bacterial DNA-binding protein